jgi:nitroreductase
MDLLFSHLLDAAGRAPSAHNTQPWALRWRGHSLEVFLRAERALPAVDPTGVEMLHAVGALLENLVLTLEQLDFEPVYEVVDSLTAGNPVLTLRWNPVRTPRPDPTLYRMIPVRQTSRLPYQSEPITTEDLEEIRQAVATPCSLAILTDPDEVETIRRLVCDATIEQLKDTRASDELYTWLRFSKRENRWYRDGLNAECMGWNRLEALALRWMLAPGILRTFGPWGLFRLLGSDVDKNAPPTPAIGLLTVEKDDIAGRIEAGRQLQRVWLTAASKGLATHPISAAVDVSRTRLMVFQRFGLPPDSLHVNLFRIGRSLPPARSHRLPVDEILLA